MGAKPEKEPIGRPLFGYVLGETCAILQSKLHPTTSKLPIIIVDYSILSAYSKLQIPAALK